MRKWTDAQLISAVAQNVTVAGVLRSLGLTVNPGSYGTVKRHAKRLGLDTAHFLGQRHGTSRITGCRTLEEYLVEDGPPLSSSSLKRKLLAAGLLKSQCAVCGQGTFWAGKTLVLQLDHVNGRPGDNRIENLRLLCPNCHTQTETFTSKRLRQPEKVCSCGVTITRKSKTCSKCTVRRGRTNGAWPDDSTLRAWLDEMTAVEIGRKVGVSPASVKKYCAVRGIPTKPQGYWQKVRAAKG